MSKDITPQNIFNYLEGSLSKVMSDAGVLTQLRDEQAAYRLDICKNDCVTSESCKKCGCALPGRAFVSQSCNVDRFPDMMNQEDWNKYKIDNGIN